MSALRVVEALVAGRGDEAAVLAWLDSGGRVNATCAVDEDDVSGVTALMLAAGNGHEPSVELLLQRGAEINLRSGDGGTALMFAALFDHPAVVRHLLRAGADTAACSASLSLIHISEPTRPY